MTMIWLRARRSFSILVILFFLTCTAKAQYFSFNCSRDTIVPACPAALCITLKGVVCDIYGLSDTYTLNPTSSYAGCVPVYVAPNDPAGTPTFLNVDDTYTGVIPLPFPFPFYGTTYNSLIASTNGYLSFDVTQAGLFADWSLPNNMPSTSYDRAVIMGPMHDLDPEAGTSPTQRIQYQTWGVAPHRRWILSFYRVPLFSGACNALIENTHQITLYESTGIIEVTVFDKQICNGWNSGRAMIGIQNFGRNQAMMPPGRAALDPPWGSIGMNESWRFVPSGGPSLFKRVELYDLGGSLIATGSTTSLGNGQLDVSFDNICAPAGGATSFVIQAVYEKMDDPSVEIFGTDTITINRANGLAATAGSTPAGCGLSDGTITVSPPNGGTPPYEYSLDGTTWQSSNTFTGLSAGTYNVFVRDNGGICTTTIPDVIVGNSGALSASANSTATACTGVDDGTITIISAGGTGPHTFTLDGGPPVPGSIPFTFTNVSAGGHTIIVTDMSTSCTSNPINVNVAAGPGVIATATPTATTCPSVNDGTILVNVTAGAGPFTYQLDGGAPQSGANPYTFTNVAAGFHQVTIVDNMGCTRPLNVTVNPGSALTASTTTVSTACSGASNGSITITPTSGFAPYTWSINGAPSVPGASPYTFTNLAAGSYTIVVTDASGCVTNPITVTINPGPLLSTTSSKTDALCNGDATGSITVTTPSMGIAPFEYSLDLVLWQTSNVFTGLAAGPYTVYYRESNGCQGSHPVIIGEPPVLNAATNTTAVVCNGQNDGIITVTASGGVSPYQYSIDGGATWQSSNIFNVAAGTYSIRIRDFNNCITIQPATVTEPLVLTANSVNTDASCDGGNDGIITITANGGNSGYQYSIDGINYQASNIFNVAPGTYNVRVRDNLGCLTSFPTTVGLSSNFTLTPQSDPTICEGTSTQLQLVSNATIYSWSPSTGLNDATISNPIANPTVTTQYIVTATLGRCSADDTVLVNVNAAPIPNAGPNGSICYGQTYQLQGSGGVSYVWTPSTYLSSTTVPDPISTPARTITYTLAEITDALGCRSLTTSQVTIDVTPPIKVKTYPFDSIGYTGEQFQLLAIPSEPNVTTYTWTPTTGLSNASIADPVVTIGMTGDDILYQVITSTPAGCKGEGYVRVRSYKGPDIYVVTAFSPNGDGKNDRFTPFPVGIKEMKYFRVFNRWGQLLFSTKTLKDGWDGKLNGIEQPTGVYVWVAEAVTRDNKVISKKGTVTLIR